MMRVCSGAPSGAPGDEAPCWTQEGFPLKLRVLEHVGAEKDIANLPPFLYFANHSSARRCRTVARATRSPCQWNIPIFKPSGIENPWTDRYQTYIGL